MPLIWSAVLRGCVKSDTERFKKRSKEPHYLHRSASVVATKNSLVIPVTDIRVTRARAQSPRLQPTYPLTMEINSRVPVSGTIPSGAPHLVAPLYGLGVVVRNAWPTSKVLELFEEKVILPGRVANNLVGQCLH